MTDSGAAEVPETAESLKAEGNALYAQENYLKAAAVYTKAIKLDQDNHVLYSNRSAALLKCNKVTKALEDALKCISLKPDWEKGWIRKAAVLEEQQALAEALEAYREAFKLSPNNKELDSKIRVLAKLLKQKAGKGDSPDSQPAQPKPPSSKAQAPPDAAVYEDMGSEEVAAFTEEYLGVLAEEIRENGSDFVPLVHFLPGPGRKGGEDDADGQHVRGAGAFETPDTLAGFCNFLRAAGEKLGAEAVLSCVPKLAIGYPRVWSKPNWPYGGADGVFAQLESQKVKRLWWIPVEGRSIGVPASMSFTDFAPMPMLLKQNA